MELIRVIDMYRKEARLELFNYMLKKGSRGLTITIRLNGREVQSTGAQG